MNSQQRRRAEQKRQKQKYAQGSHHSGDGRRAASSPDDARVGTCPAACAAAGCACTCRDPHVSARFVSCSACFRSSCQFRCCSCRTITCSLPPSISPTLPVSPFLPPTPPVCMCVCMCVCVRARACEACMRFFYSCGTHGRSADRGGQNGCEKCR